MQQTGGTKLTCNGGWIMTPVARVMTKPVAGIATIFATNVAALFRGEKPAPGYSFCKYVEPLEKYYLVPVN